MNFLEVVIVKTFVIAVALIVGLALSTLWIPDEWIAAAIAGEEDVVSKATTVKSNDLLKVPAGVDAKLFTMAKVAPTVDVCFFAGLQDRGKGTLWSSWGDGCLHSNGKYYTSIGDHLGTDASCHVYEYDPATRQFCGVSSTYCVRSAT